MKLSKPACPARAFESSLPLKANTEFETASPFALNTETWRSFSQRLSACVGESRRADIVGDPKRIVMSDSVAPPWIRLGWSGAELRMVAAHPAKEADMQTIETSRRSLFMLWAPDLLIAYAVSASFLALAMQAPRPCFSVG